MRQRRGLRVRDCGVRARSALTFSAVEFETRALGGDPAWADAATAWGVAAAKFTSLHSLGGAQCQPSAAGTTCSLIPGAIGAASCQVAGGADIGGLEQQIMEMKENKRRDLG